MNTIEISRLAVANAAAIRAQIRNAENIYELCDILNDVWQNHSAEELNEIFGNDFRRDLPVWDGCDKNDLPIIDDAVYSASQDGYLVFDWGDCGEYDEYFDKEYDPSLSPAWNVYNWDNADWDNADWGIEAANKNKSWSMGIRVNIACDPSDWGDCGEGYEYDGDEDDRQSAYEHECSENFAQMYESQIQELAGELGFEFDECECTYYHAPCRTGFDSAEIYFDNVAVFKTNLLGVKKYFPVSDFEKFLTEYITSNIDDDDVKTRYMNRYH